MFLVLPLWAAAQFFPIPIPLTDSVSDNRNPEMMLLNGYEAFMAWEKSNSPDSTAIYGKIIHASGIFDTVTFKIIGKSGVHYTNPQLMFTEHSGGPFQDTLLYSFFESEEGGDMDIQYMKYDANGFLYGPFPFATGPGNQHSLSMSDSYFFTSVGLTWQSGDSIWFASAVWSNPLLQYVFGGHVLIDAIGVGHPVIDNTASTIMWEKAVNGSTKVAFSIFNDLVQAWSPPITKMKAGNNSQISQVKGLWGMEGGTFVWRSDDSPLTHLHAHSFSPWSADSSDRVSGSNFQFPCASFAPIIIKSTKSVDYLFMVHQSDSMGNNEIYYHWPMFGSGDQNLSNNSSEDVHPKMFLLPGFGNWIYELAVTWESFRNGHWQLWYSFVDMTGGIDPVPDAKFVLNALPNPFTDNLRLEYNLTDDQDVTIAVFNSTGQKLLEIPKVTGHAGTNYFSFDDATCNIANLAPGTYMIQVACKEGSRMVKGVKL